MPYLTISRIAALNGIEVTQGSADASYKDLEDAGSVIFEKAGLPAPELISKGLSLIGKWLGLGGKPKKIQQNVLLASMLTQYFVAAGKNASMVNNVCVIRVPVNGLGVDAVANHLLVALRKQYSAGSDDYYDLGLGINSLHIDSVTGVYERVPVAQWTENIATGDSTPDINVDDETGTPPAAAANKPSPVLPLLAIAGLIFGGGK